MSKSFNPLEPPPLKMGLAFAMGFLYFALAWTHLPLFLSVFPAWLTLQLTGALSISFGACVFYLIRAELQSLQDTWRDWDGKNTFKLLIFTALSVFVASNEIVELFESSMAFSVIAASPLLGQLLFGAGFAGLVLFYINRTSKFWLPPEDDETPWSFSPLSIIGYTLLFVHCCTEATIAALGSSYPLVLWAATTMLIFIADLKPFAPRDQTDDNQFKLDNLLPVGYREGQSLLYYLLFLGTAAAGLAVYTTPMTALLGVLTLHIALYLSQGVRAAATAGQSLGEKARDVVWFLFSTLAASTTGLVFSIETKLLLQQFNYSLSPAWCWFIGIIGFKFDGESLVGPRLSDERRDSPVSSKMVKADQEECTPESVFQADIALLSGALGLGNA